VERVLMLRNICDERASHEAKCGPIDIYMRNTWKYKKSIGKGPDGIFRMAVPDFPGCTAEGVSVDEAFDNLKLAMREWISSRITSGQNVPDPS
jgi:predicted RNase H-like HicB family nuclease